jgi:D-alanyl-lipoteichoic acid acyltransferase DltB (MBOAT superfamily)
MLFSSQEFVLGFLPVCLAGFFLLGRFAGRAWALRWLLGASLFFYGWWAPCFVPLLAGSIAANYLLGGRILAMTRTGRRRAARRWLTCGIAADLGLLGWFKYAGFLAATLNDLSGIGLPVPRPFLPLAISFFTFQQIMFLVDLYRDARAPVRLLPYACFVGFFPHLIAGPIVRPREIVPQFTAAGVALPRMENLTEGMTLFLLGLAKKLVLADMFARFADVGFAAAASGETLSLIEAWYAALAYSLQIYFDFSGYSDMAIGLARMFNIRFPLNFDSPYKSRDIAEFWRRWHITLSRFLRDYLYIPLGGNRCGAWRGRANLMATMLLGGLWHGAAWNFVIWGGLHGTFLIAHRIFRQTGMRLPGVAARGLTLLAVIVAWVPFRADGLAATAAMLRGMAGLSGIALPQMIVGAFPPLARLAEPVPVLRFLADARTLSFPEVSACLALGWGIALFAPHVHQLSVRARGWALTGGFAFTVQALFFAPDVTPFLYFRF